MRGRVNAIRTFKGLVADLRYNREILCSASKLIIALPCRYNVAIDARNTIKLPRADFRSNALISDKSHFFV